MTTIMWRRSSRTRQRPARVAWSVRLASSKARLRARLPAVRTALLSLLSYGLVSYGTWLAWAPAGFVVGGLLVLVLDWQMGDDKPSVTGGNTS